MPNGVSRFCAPAFTSSFPRKRESRFQVSQRLPWAPAFEAVTYFRTRALWRFARGQRRIPLFHAEKQQNTPVQARRRRNPALQVVDFAWIRREFRYGDEQRKFGGRSGELNDLADELQRNLFVRRIFLPASEAGIPHELGFPAGQLRLQTVAPSSSPTPRNDETHPSCRGRRGAGDNCRRHPLGANVYSGQPGGRNG